MTDWKLSNEPTRYPLWCVDRGMRVDPEHQYLGPFSSHDEAHEKTSEGEFVRSCRRLSPSEIDMNFASIRYLRTIWEVEETVDEVATSGNLPACSWSPLNESIVSIKSFTREMPTADNYKEWLDAHLLLNAHICEGDE